MSQLKQYDISDLVDIGWDPSDQSRTAYSNIEPGTLVRHKDHPRSFGTAVTRTWGPTFRPLQVLVLWSVTPGAFVLPNVRRVHTPTFANQLTSIQPMTAPAGLVFYLDYQYNSGSV